MHRLILNLIISHVPTQRHTTDLSAASSYMRYIQLRHYRSLEHDDSIYQAAQISSVGVHIQGAAKNTCSAENIIDI